MIFNLLLALRTAVRLGEHRKSTPIDCEEVDEDEDEDCLPDKPPFQDILIDATIVHEDYNRKSKMNDIALIRLKSEPIFKKIINVKTICLPVSSDQTIESLYAKDPSLKLTVSGWGRTGNNSLSDVLLQAFVPYVKPRECEALLEKLKVKTKSEPHLAGSRIDVEIHDSHLVKIDFY